MGVAADWLASRVAADDRARAATVDTMLPLLISRLRGAQDQPIRIIDVGAGSGANHRWLSPRLPLRQQWIHLDHDAAILAHTDPRPTDPGAVGQPDDTRFVVGGIDELARLIEEDPGSMTVVTCAAVLDVLTRADLELLTGLVVTRRIPALLSLSVTGEFRLDPADAADRPLLMAFDEHQRRDGRSGPDAPELVTGWARAAGVTVVEVPTPWRLGRRDDPTFVNRFLRERIDAAVEQEPGLQQTGQAWLARRLAQLADTELQITVGHVDLLLLP